MNISEPFIRRPIMTVLVTICVAIFGVSTYNRLPVSDLPTVDYPVMTISVGYPGASPSTMASAIASPLENQCMQIPGVQSIISANTEGGTQITLSFELDRNVDLAAPDVQAAISAAMGDLPSDLPSPPTYSKNNPTDQPIMYITVYSPTLTLAQMYDFANRMIARRLSMISGVSRVQVYGAKGAVRVQVDPTKLAAYSLTLTDISSVIQNGTVTIPGGSLNGATRTFALEPQGQLLQASDYKKLIVTYSKGNPIRLEDVAICVDGVENDLVNVMIGTTADQVLLTGPVVIPVYRRAGANTVALADRIKNTVDELRKTLPESVKIKVFYDKSEQIVDSINDVKFTIILALALVVLVIFLFLGRIKDTVIPSVALPLSLLATFIAMYALGFSLDNLSMMGLTLAIGFVVDDAIVVLENTVRLVEMGKKPFAAAIESAKEISGTVVSMTLALVTVFVPLVFMTGAVGRTFREFAITVVAAVLCSGVVSLTLTPMMCARMIAEHKGDHESKNFFQSLVDWILNRVNTLYGRSLMVILKHRWLAVVIWLACLGGTGAFFMVLPKTFMPEGDSGSVQGAMLLPQGASTEVVRSFQNQVNAVFMSDPNVDRIVTLSGLQPGADQSMNPFFVMLKPHNKRQPIDTVVQELRMKLMMVSQLGYAFVMAMPSLKVSAGAEDTASGSRYSYAVSGADQDEVYKAAQDLEKRMRDMKTVFTDIQTSVKLNMPQLSFTILRDRASTLGVTAKDIEYALALAFAWGRVTTYKTDIDQYKVIVELDRKYQRDPENVSRIYLRSSTTGDLVPLGAVATWEETVGPQNVPHWNQQNSATISFNLLASVAIGDATQTLETIARETLPPSISGRLQGEAQEFQEAVANLSVLIVIAVFLMYVILGILYESYIHPFTVLTTLPVAAFGGLMTLLLFRAELSMYAYIGLFMLMGIVAKNGIMMVDFAEQNLAQGKNALDSIYDACRVRFRPILMTGMAAIMGAVPIAMGIGADGASRRPLGLIVVGGLIFSQVFTLYVTPGIFLYMQQFQDRVLNRFELTRAGASRHGEQAA